MHEIAEQPTKADESGSPRITYSGLCDDEDDDAVDDCVDEDDDDDGSSSLFGLNTAQKYATSLQVIEAGILMLTMSTFRKVM